MLVDARHGPDAVLALLKRRMNPFILDGSELEIQQAGNDVQVVLTRWWISCSSTSFSRLIYKLLFCLILILHLAPWYSATEVAATFKAI